MVSAGFGMFTGILNRLIGAQVLTDIQTFVGSVDTLFGGFRQRADETYAMLQAPDTAFVVVVEASPRLSLQLVGGNSVVIQVSGPAGALCRLEQAETATGAWTPVVGVADLATQGFSTPVPITIPGPLQNGRLYRLRVL